MAARKRDRPAREIPYDPPKQTTGVRKVDRAEVEARLTRPRPYPTAEEIADNPNAVGEWIYEVETARYENSVLAWMRDEERHQEHLAKEEARAEKEAQRDADYLAETTQFREALDRSTSAVSALETKLSREIAELRAQLEGYAQRLEGSDEDRARFEKEIRAELADLRQRLEVVEGLATLFSEDVKARRDARKTAQATGAADGENAGGETGKSPTA